MKREAAFVLANASEEATEHQICLMVEAGALDALTTMLSEHDVELACITLNGIDNILTVGQGGEEDENAMVAAFDSKGGLRKLEELQLHPNKAVFEKVQVIMEKFYSLEPIPIVELEKTYAKQSPAGLPQRLPQVDGQPPS